MTDPTDLDAAQRLADAATPGPWRSTARGIDGGENYWVDVIAPGRVDCMAYCYGGSSTLEMDNETADVDFIVTARSLVPQLISELRAARVSLTQAQADTDAIRNQVAAWIDDAPSGSAGLDLLRQIITPVPDAVLDLRARWAQLDAVNARAAALLAQPEDSPATAGGEPTTAPTVPSDLHGTSDERLGLRPLRRARQL